METIQMEQSYPMLSLKIGSYYKLALLSRLVVVRFSQSLDE